ncbi:MAG: hypothetical protein ABL963_06990 [Longimicrobiales bacterium]
MKTVPRIGRVLDLVGLLLFLGGGALFVRAWLGFQSVPDYQPSVDDPAWAAVSIADGYWRLQKIGVAIMVAGIAVFVAAWWVARRGGRSAHTTEPPTL